MVKRIFLGIVVSLIVMLPAARSQTRPQRPPALIRDTDTAEGKEAAEPSKEKPPYNPMEAQKSFTIGNYYFKGKNYEAAILRYLEALDFQPDFIKAYEALARAYEKNRQFDKALQVYKDFVVKNPDSAKAGEFRSKIAKLEQK